jgi:hypothetical protein
VNGAGRELMVGEKELFGEDMDIQVSDNVVFLYEGEEVEIADIEIHVVRNGDVFDLKIPEINAIHTHALCHNTHSVVFKPRDARMMARRLTEYLREGYSIFMTAHHSFEGPSGVYENIAYFNSLGEIFNHNRDAVSFIRAMHSRFPRYSGDYYLGITAKMFAAGAAHG